MGKVKENELLEESVYEETRNAKKKELRKQRKEEQKLEKQAEKQEKKEEKKQKKLTARQEKMMDYKRRVRIAHKKARRIGWWYVLFTIVVAASAFLPLFISIDGTFSILTIWNALFKLKLLKGSLAPVLVSLFGTIFYVFIVFTVVFNAIKALKCIRSLYFKKPSFQNGYNRPAQAMGRLGEIYSGTLIALVLFGYLMRILASVELTPLFWVVLALGVIVHFWLGLRSGGVSFFPVDKKQEIKRMGGMFAPFMRNVFQLITVSFMMKYFLETNLILNLISVLPKGGISKLFSSSTSMFTNVTLPIVHVLMLVCLIILVNHALKPHEFHHDGKRAPGRKVFRTGSFLLLIAAIGSFIVTFLVSKIEETQKFSMSYGSLYIAVLALAAIIEEFAMRNLPRWKDNILVDFESEPDPIPVVITDPNAPEGGLGYHVPISCITDPGVFMQPNGQPVMVLPMIAGPQKAPAQVDLSHDYNGNQESKEETVVEPDVQPVEGVGLSKSELHERAFHEKRIAELTDKWVNMAKNPPRFGEEKEDAENFAESNPYVAKLIELREESEKEPAESKNWTVACPECGASVYVQSGSFAYRCPTCDCVFKLRNKQDN